MSNLIENKPSTDSTGMTFQCSQNYHLAGNAFLVEATAKIAGVYSGL